MLETHRLKVMQYMIANRFINRLLPPPGWRLPVIVIVGILSGLGVLVLYISNAASYLSDSPSACMNCHVMAPQYATWQRGSHGRVATCNDCHVPHDNALLKYAFKAKDGLRHASMFTLHLEPQVMQIKDAGIDVVQENCKRCHANLIHMTSMTTVTGEAGRHGEGSLCWHCHRDVPHGRVNSLASTPWARVPLPSKITPDWIMALTQNFDPNK